MKLAVTKYIAFVGFIALSFGVFGQQEAQFSHITNNPYLLNPAAGGTANVFNIEMVSRMQWAGYQGGPRTMMLAGYSPIKIGKSAKREAFNESDDLLFQSPEVSLGEVKHIVGGRASLESIGVFNQTNLYGTYAIHIPFSKKLNMGVGLGVGWSNFGILEDRVVLFEADDASYEQFLGGTSAQNIFDANAGLTLYGENFFFGASTTQLLKNKVQFSDVLTTSNYNRHYFFIGSYTIAAGEKIGIEPNAVIKLAENSPFSGDFGVRLRYNRSSWLGVQYRTNNAVIFQLGTNLVKNIYVSYAYEHSVGAIRTAGHGTHEIQLGFYLGKNRKADKDADDAAK